MAEGCNCTQAITGAFEDVALALGGVVAMYPIPDEATWDLARALEAIYGRVRARCGATFAQLEDSDDVEPHPAIVHLLDRIQRQRADDRVGR